MKHLFSILTAVFAVFALLVSCGGSEGTGNGEASGAGGSGSNSGGACIKGVVYDYLSEHPEPLSAALVQLYPEGGTVFTNEYGMYRFDDLTPGKQYWLSVSKAEYVYDDDYKITAEKDKCVQHDITLKKDMVEVVTLEVRDNNGNPLPVDEEYGLPYLDLGKDLISRQFQIYNGSPVAIEFNVNKAYLKDWVESINLVDNYSGDLKPGKATGVVAKINRDDPTFLAGTNKTTVQVLTNNGNFEFLLVATKDADSPIVRTLPVTEGYEAGPYSDKYKNVFHAEVTAVGNPAYTERGFCYSSSNQTPGMESGKCEKDSEKGVEGKYEFSIWEYDKTQYYVRAYLKWNGEIIYGNVESFVWKGGDNGSGSGNGTSECTSGQYKCDGSYSHYCFGGNWDSGEYCPNGCNSSTGMCAECVSGQYKCNDDYSLRCSDGKWDFDDYCIDGCNSSTGRCE